MTEDDTAGRIAGLEADNRRLRRLLEERALPGELRHRFRNTLAMIRVVIRRSVETSDDLEAYAAQLDDRIDAIARAQSAVDLHGWIQLDSLLADELHFYAAQEGVRGFFAGPLIRFAPRAGQIFALAVHELAVNAVEHGALSSPTGLINVDWRVSGEGTGSDLVFVWKESGTQEAAGADARSGFGTEVLTRTIAYELGATTTFTFEPDGLRCEIRMPWTDRIGTIAIE